METSAAAVKTSACTAMETAATSTMETAAAAAVRTASASAVTAASMLSECGICCECKADESSKCDERCAKTECAHNQYLPLEPGSALSRESVVEMATLYFMRFYCQARGCADSKSLRAL
jgi:hypothetical protein